MLSARFVVAAALWQNISKHDSSSGYEQRSEERSAVASRWRSNGSPRLTRLTQDSSEQVVIFLMDDENTSNYEDLGSPRAEVTGVGADFWKRRYLPDLRKAFRPNRTDE